jgi:hypothetical protein
MMMIPSMAAANDVSNRDLFGKLYEHWYPPPDRELREHRSESGDSSATDP